MPLPIRVIRLRRGDRARLQRVTRSRTAPQLVVERARIVLASAAAESGSAICATLGVSRPTVTLWLDRYEAEGFGPYKRPAPLRPTQTPDPGPRSGDPPADAA